MINSICGGVRMNFSLVTIIDEDLNQYKADMQEAFQKGFEDVFGKTEDIILPEKDIDNSLNQKNSCLLYTSCRCSFEKFIFSN